jgi:hypothetical protein
MPNYEAQLRENWRAPSPSDPRNPATMRAPDQGKLQRSSAWTETNLGNAGTNGTYRTIHPPIQWSKL